MKKWILILLSTVGFFSGCQSQLKKEIDNNTDISNSMTNNGANSMQMKIENQEFLVYLEDNQTVQALLSYLPITVTMEELNGNEKYYYFDKELPSNSSSIGQIQAGDIMLYGDTCLVLFYDSFSTSYPYTRIGHIEAVEQLLQVIKKGSIEVSIKI